MRCGSARRGFTLVEMLVAVALLVLMMSIVAAIFSSATAAISGLRTFQELDGHLQQIDSTIRQDLMGATAKFTPPLDPDNGDGYMEYGENQFADFQGEDSDDYIRFTAKAPEGQFFTGRFYVQPLPSVYAAMVSNGLVAQWIATQPIMIQSQYAEIIYFMRNGNLYRRVLLIVPERQLAVSQGVPIPTAGLNLFPSPTFGGQNVGWMAVNDVSARPQFNPNPIGAVSGVNLNWVPHLNTLGDLTNRHNRAFYPRFSDDYYSISNGNATPDGITDDLNLDAVPDMYPTLYASPFSNASVFTAVSAVNNQPLINQITLNNPPPHHAAYNADFLAFPYIYPGAYSQPDSSVTGVGLIHGFPSSAGETVGLPMVAGAPVVPLTPPPNSLPLPPYGNLYVNGMPVTTSSVAPIRPNHSPLVTGDTLANCVIGSSGISLAVPQQTWWGFPTWRETASPNWLDPVIGTNNPGSFAQAPGLSWQPSSLVLLPPLNDPELDMQPFTESNPAGTYAFAFRFSATGPTDLRVYRDDLILEGVRSFDVKAYDDSYPGYVDLGYSNFVSGAPNAQVGQLLLNGMGHEGRIPPLSTDYRADPNTGFPIDDNQAGILRLRRVWDSWSTDYSSAPQMGMTPGGFPIGPPFSQPVYPSYPAPYPAPLRGIQIQIRVTDPRNERIKTLTIRQDFSDRL